nr:PREDICTED: uncharacterized protein LOC102689512 isoform X1 [Lepisosteus oculatus]
MCASPCAARPWCLPGYRIPQKGGTAATRWCRNTGASAASPPPAAGSPTTGSSSTSASPATPSRRTARAAPGVATAGGPPRCPAASPSRVRRARGRPPQLRRLKSRGWSPEPEDQNTNTNTLPGVAMTAVSVSIFLVTTTACVVIKSRLQPCHSDRRSSDQLDLMIDGGPVPLPSYEEAVYGSRGERIPPSQGPTQLLLAREPPGLHPSHAGPGSQPETTCLCPLANQTTTLAPPPYEEVQSESRGGVGRELRQELTIAVASHKENSADTCCPRGTDNYSMV